MRVKSYVGGLLFAASLRAAASSRVTSSKVAPVLLGREDDKPNDFTWVKKWAAIGDSFTAGIGSGNQLSYVPTPSRTWQCSRYDYSYVKIVDNALGPSVQDFQFEACSGDRTGDIYKQVDNIQNDLDLVLMTAGGNDLCLAAMIKTCVIMPWEGEDACTTLINKAQSNIDTMLKDNIRQVLTKLSTKMKKDSILVYSGYAPFFNTENEDCADPKKQEWALVAWRWWQFWNLLRTPLRLTIDRRKKFNTLVANINEAIEGVVGEYDKDVRTNFKAVFSDWSEFPSLVDGQFCSPKSSGRYPDPDQPDLLFTKFDTTIQQTPVHDETKRDLLGADNSTTKNNGEDVPTTPAHPQMTYNAREVEEIERDVAAYQNHMRGRLSREHIYDNLLWKSADPRAEALHRLDPRAPVPPGCPLDGTPGVPFGLGLPDSFLSIFHPNKQGHEAMAAYALQNIMYKRAEILKVDDGLCAADKDEFKCWQKQGRSAYVEYDRVNENYKDFCNNKVKPPDNTINWKASETYHKDTPDEHTFALDLSDGASKYDKDQCLEAFDKIINSCDGGDSNNPLNFKYGGSWVRGNYRYELNPKMNRKMTKKRSGTCRGWWSVFFTGYRVYGRGWASSDYGQKTLLKSMGDCGSAVTAWKFDYCPQGCGDNNEFEWKAEFNLPVYGGVACMRNNWVPRQNHAEWVSEGTDSLGCNGAA